MGTIQLEDLKVEGNKVDYRFAVTDDLRPFFASAMHLFMHYDRSVAEIPESILVIPFLSNVMQIAWLTDSEVIVNCVDTVFYHSLQRLQKAYQDMYPNCSLHGDLHAICEETAPLPGTIKSAQMYTGGLDAVTTFIRHQEEHPLLILEYGFYQEALIRNKNYSNDEKSERNYLSDHSATENFALEHRVNTAYIRSNYGTFVNNAAVNKCFSKSMGDTYWHGLHHAMAILGTAAPIAYMEKIKTLYIASSFSVGNTYPCASDPTTDNEFRFAGTSVVHDGYELTDQDKARVVVDYQKAIGKTLPLRVCSWNDHNCCACEKCLRRMLQINAEGGNPQNFGFVYDTKLLDVVKEYLKKEIQFFTPKNLDKWHRIISRMKENYTDLFEPEVYDFLKNYDFYKEKKIGLLRYYFINFFDILSRKMKSLFRRG